MTAPPEASALSSGLLSDSAVERLFRGRLSGAGEVRGLTGRVLRGVTVSFTGIWSEPHRALHLDEDVSYADGARLSRRWVVHADDDGFVSGVEATQGGRLRGREVKGGLRLVFDRPRRPGSSLTLPKVRLLFRETAPGVVDVAGRTLVLGAPVRWTTLRLVRDT